MAAGKRGLDLALLIAKRITASNGFDRVLSKVKITSGGEGQCTAELKVEPEHQNAGGTLHGGLTATIVDVISTVALMTHERANPGVTVDLHVSYMKGAKEGDVVLINANTLKAGKTLAFLEVELKNKDTGALIAKGSHTKFIGSG